MKALFYVILSTLIFDCSVDAKNIILTNQLEYENYSLCIQNEFDSYTNVNYQNIKLSPIFNTDNEFIYRYLYNKCNRHREKIIKKYSKDKNFYETLNELDEYNKKYIYGKINSKREFFSKIAEQTSGIGPRKAIALHEKFDSDFQDFPAQAFIKNNNGEFKGINVVYVTIVIGKNGVLSKCTSRGMSDLINSKVCEIFIKKSKYFPAIDSNSQFIDEIIETRVGFSVQNN